MTDPPKQLLLIQHLRAQQHAVKHVPNLTLREDGPHLVNPPEDRLAVSQGFLPGVSLWDVRSGHETIERKEGLQETNRLNRTRSQQEGKDKVDLSLSEHVRRELLVGGSLSLGLDCV